MSVSSTPALQTRWQLLAPRERTLVAGAAALIALALLWWVALAPALATLRAAPAQHAALDAQLQHMQALQAEALQWQAAPRTSPADAHKLLQSALAERLGGTAQMSLAAERATITLKGAAPEPLAQWLAQARSNARATPVQARLTQTAANAAAPARWDGTLVLTLAPQ